LGDKRGFFTSSSPEANRQRRRGWAASRQEQEAFLPRRQAIPRGMNRLGRRRGTGAVGMDDNVSSGAGVAVASGD